MPPETPAPTWPAPKKVRHHHHEDPPFPTEPTELPTAAMPPIHNDGPTAVAPLDDYKGPQLNALENELDQLNSVGEEVTISKLGEPVITKKVDKKANVPIITDGMVNAFKSCNVDDQEPECKYWAGIGECEATSMRMLDQCCRSCQKRFTQDEQVLRKLANPEFSPYSKLVPKQCTDQYSECTYWGSLGECSKNEATMSVRCCKTCSKVMDINYGLPD